MSLGRYGTIQCCCTDKLVVMSLGWHVVLNLGRHGAVLYGNNAYLDGKNSVWHGTVLFGYKAILDKQNLGRHGSVQGGHNATFIGMILSLDDAVLCDHRATHFGMSHTFLAGAYASKAQYHNCWHELMSAWVCNMWLP